jgi:hypothetical protein
MKKGFERGRCPLFREEDDALHILLECLETRKWRELVLSRKWLIANKKVAYKKTNFMNVVELQYVGK